MSYFIPAISSINHYKKYIYYDLQVTSSTDVWKSPWIVTESVESSSQNERFKILFELN